MASANDPTRPLPLVREFQVVPVPNLQEPGVSSPPLPGDTLGPFASPSFISFPANTPSIFQHSVLKNYRFLQCLEQNSYGSIWKVQLQSGQVKALYHLHGLIPEKAAAGIRKLQQLEHHVLAELHFLCEHRDQILLLGNFPGQTLRTRFTQYWKRGLPGIPPLELIGYLRTIAEPLDYFSTERGLHHLALNPDQLVFSKDGLQLHGLGLMQLLWLPEKWLPPILNARYSPPEFFQRRYTGKSDQYSLALIYAKMRTGVHPFARLEAVRNKPGSWPEPNLQLLSTPEQEILHQALSPAPFDRFGSCRELVRTLQTALGTETAESKFDRETFGQQIPAESIHEGDGIIEPEQLALVEINEDFLRKLEQVTCGGMQFRKAGQFHYYLEPGVCIEHSFQIRMRPEQIRIALERFQEQWVIRKVERKRQKAIFFIEACLSWWIWGKRPGCGLIVEVAWHPEGPQEPDLWVVYITISPQDCAQELGSRLLEETGPSLLKSLRNYLKALPEVRAETRWECKHPLRVLPVYHDLNTLQSVECLGKDISTQGVGFYTLGWIPATLVYIQLPWLPQFRNVAVRSTIVRTLPYQSGWFEIGARFEK